MINLTIPIHNEESSLEKKIIILADFLSNKKYSENILVVLADNASSDRTRKVCGNLVENTKMSLTYQYSPVKGKGNAIRESWLNHSAEQYWFMDLDLSTDLRHLDDLYTNLLSYEIVIGSRLLPESQVTRSIKREVLSRGYNFLLERMFGKKFSDAQCGFKGVTQRVIDEIVSQTTSNGYFFDSELLLLAERLGYDIKEIPVVWREDCESNVKLHRTIPYFLKKVYAFKVKQ